jgi:apolipoprotein D and lipocalin family protein
MASPSSTASPSIPVSPAGKVAPSRTMNPVADRVGRAVAAMRGWRRALAVMMASLALWGCASGGDRPITTVPRVDLERFMGRWYVIASIPTFIERDAHNAVETYTLGADGTIDTVFTFRDGAFDGPARRYNPRGYVLDRTTNAVWGMQFIWPIKSDFRIVSLADDYSLTVIGREARDYAWIMARTPAIAEPSYAAAVALLSAQGYDVGQLRKVPQQWP